MDERRGEPTSAMEMAGLLDRRVAAAADQIQRQLEQVIRVTDQRVDANRESSEARIQAIDNLGLTRFNSMRDFVEAKHSAVMGELAGLQRLLEERIVTNDKALLLQAREYERRLASLDIEHDRLVAMQASYVRSDIYVKDMERLYTERQQGQAATEKQRIFSENAAVTNRRATLLTLVSAAVSVIAIILSVVLHFIAGKGV